LARSSVTRTVNISNLDVKLDVLLRASLDGNVDGLHGREHVNDALLRNAKTERRQLSFANAEKAKMSTFLLL